MKERTSFRRSYAMLYNTYRFLSSLFLFCYGERVMKRAVFFADVSLTLNRMASGQQERSRCRMLRGSKTTDTSRKSDFLIGRQAGFNVVKHFCFGSLTNAMLSACMKKMRETDEPWAYCITLCHNYFTGVKGKIETKVRNHVFGEG